LWLFCLFTLSGLLFKFVLLHFDWVVWYLVFLPLLCCLDHESNWIDQVIKIEDSLGDYCRYFPPLLEDSNGPAFHALNRGKKSIVLDFRKPSDVATFHSLCETAHVVLETFRPGVLNKFGLSPSQLRARHPHLVYCSVESWA